MINWSLAPMAFSRFSSKAWLACERWTSSTNTMVFSCSAAVWSMSQLVLRLLWWQLSWCSSLGTSPNLGRQAVHLGDWCEWTGANPISYIITGHKINQSCLWVSYTLKWIFCNRSQTTVETSNINMCQFIIHPSLFWSLLWNLLGLCNLKHVVTKYFPREINTNHFWEVPFLNVFLYQSKLKKDTFFTKQNDTNSRIMQIWNSMVPHVFV